MLYIIRRWFAAKPANDDADMLADILRIGQGGPVVLESRGVEIFGARVREMEAAGLVALRSIEAGLLITPLRQRSEPSAWTVQPASHRGAVRRGSCRHRPGPLLRARNPIEVRLGAGLPADLDGRQPTAHDR